MKENNDCAGNNEFNETWGHKLGGVRKPTDRTNSLL